MTEWKDLDNQSLGPVGKKFTEFASERIIGQDKAVSRIAKALDLHASELRIDGKPIYVSLLIGGAASGKTLLAKIVAEFWFGSPDAMTVLPCSDFLKTDFTQWDIDKYDYYYIRASNKAQRELLDIHNKNSDNRMAAMQALAQAQNGGAEDSVIEKLQEEFQKADKEYQALFKKVKPIIDGFKSVVVFDHIEDGRPEVQDELSRILERGLHIRGMGDEQSVVSFRNSVIFIMSNDCVHLGDEKKEKKLGFDAGAGLTGNKSDDNRRYLRTTLEINDYFSERLLSHLDRVEILREYSKETLLKILEIFIKNFQNELAGKFPIKLTIEDDVREYLVIEGSDHAEHGIRLLKRKFDKYIRRQLGLLRLSKQVVFGDVVSAYMKAEDKNRFVAFRKKQ